MSTFISDTAISHLQTSPSALEYVTLTGDVSRSGNTVTLSNLSVSVRVSYVYSCYGETQNYYIADSASGGALTQTGSFEFNFSDGPNHTESHSMSNMSFSVTASQTSATFYLRATSNEDTQIAFTVTFESGVVAPTTPTVSLSTAGTDNLTVSYGTTSFGNPSSGTVYLYGGTSSSPTTQLTSKSSTGQSTYNYSSLTANTIYYFRSNATNGDATSSYSSDISGVTLAEAPSVAVDSYGNSSVTISYTTTADGGYYDKFIQYSIDGGTTWTTGAIVSSGSVTSGIYTISGLSSGTTYTIQTRVTTTAGSTTGATLTVTTTSGGIHLYGAVSDGQGGYVTEEVEKLYGPVSDGNGGYETKKIEKLYGPISDGSGGYVTKLIYLDDES